MATQSIVLSCKFLLPSHNNIPHTVTLTSDAITCTPADNNQRHSDDESTGETGENSTVVCMDDVIGCNLVKDGDDACVQLKIYSYPKGGGGGGDNRSGECRRDEVVVRERREVVLVYDSSDQQEDNMRVMKAWKQQINSILQARSWDDGAGSTFTTHAFASGKKLLFIINPFSGRKQAISLLKSMEGMFREAHLNHAEVVTERPNHAREIARDLDLDAWGGVVIASGDGLIYEVLNGFMDRDDWREALKMPIGALPCGSGNALCSSINYKAKEPYLESFLLHSTFILLKHVTMPMDLMSVDLCDSSRVYGFLAVAWAIVADVDIESERWRYLGVARFSLVALWKIFMMNQYRGRLSFLPVEPYTNPDTNTTTCPPATDDLTNHNRMERDALPALSAPVPDGWVTFEDNFVFFTATLTSHLTSDTVIVPESELDDGIIYLNILRAGVTRLQLLKLFLWLSESDVAKRDDAVFERIKVRAFRMVPLSDEGIMTVDGEVVPHGPIQAHVMPHAANLMCRTVRNS